MPTLPCTTAAADHYGQVKPLLKHQGMPIGEMDTQIAAHALAEDLILVTHNARHFKSVPGLKLEDWVVWSVATTGSALHANPTGGRDGRESATRRNPAGRW